MLFAVEQNVAIKDVAIAAIARLPETVAEHDDFVSAGTIFFRQETCDRVVVGHQTAGKKFSVTE